MRPRKSTFKVGDPVKFRDGSFSGTFIVIKVLSGNKYELRLNEAMTATVNEYQLEAA